MGIILLILLYSSVAVLFSRAGHEHFIPMSWKPWHRGNSDGI